jgi:hypothetical protein
MEDNIVVELRDELERTMAQLIAQQQVAEVLAVMTLSCQLTRM